MTKKCDAHDNRPLSRNEALVFEALRRADQPLSAYALLDGLRNKGLRAPAQVYRALDRLVENGQAHRLESLNAFVACNHSHCEEAAQAAFAICEDCGTVTEFADPDLEARLVGLAETEGFTLIRSTVELRGRCAVCGKAT